jgi:hypothetical protein
MPAFASLEPETSGRKGSLLRVEGLLSALVARALRGTAGLRTLVYSKIRPEAIDRSVVQSQSFLDNVGATSSVLAAIAVGGDVLPSRKTHRRTIDDRTDR